MKTPIDESKKDPALLLMEAMILGGSESIVASEKRGQRQLCESQVLPVDCRGDLATLGIKVTGPVPGDPLFQFVELPKGWSKKPTDHDMWSDLIDDKGRKRAAIFYKAASYDRSSHMHLCCRYNLAQDYSEGRDKEKNTVRVMDGATVLHESVTLKSEDRWAEQARKKAEDWLKNKFPDYQNPADYWD